AGRRGPVGAGRGPGNRPGPRGRRGYAECVMTYLDHAATTPVLPEVLAAMTEQLGRVGNASSLHASGREARRVAEQSRERMAEALGDGTDVAVASVMWANNEIGTVSDVPALARVAHAVGVPLHTDAVQAVGQVPVDFGASGVDALTMTGHKLGGPMGAGALLL